MHTSVTAVATDSGVTAVATDSAVTAVALGSAVTAVATDNAVTAMFTLVWQRCAHHCESSGNWQRCRSTVSCHRCRTNVHIVISVLSLPLLSQRCARFHCHSTVLVFAVTALCTSVSNTLWDSTCVTRWLDLCGAALWARLFVLWTPTLVAQLHPQGLGRELKQLGRERQRRRPLNF